MFLASLQVLLGVILGYKKQARVSKQFIYFSIVLFAWTLLNTGLSYLTSGSNTATSNLGLINLINSLGFLAGTTTLVYLYQLVRVFPVEHKKTKASGAIISAGIVLAVISALPFIAGKYELGQQGITYNYGALTPLIFAYYLLVVLASIRTVLASHKSLDERVKLQATTILISLLVTSVLAITIIIILPPLLNNDSFIFLGYFTPYIFTGTLFYSIFKQRFLNFQALVARSAAYFLAISLILTIYIGLVVLITDSLTSQPIHVGITIAFAALGILFALIFPGFIRLFNRLTNKIFYRDYYNPQIVLDNLSELLARSVDVDEIESRAASIIKHSLKPTSARLVLKARPQDVEDYKELINSLSLIHKEILVRDQLSGKHQELISKLDEKDVSVSIRLHNKKAIMGFLLLGGKESGNPYSLEDLSILGIISDELAVGLQNALHFEEISRFNLTLQEKVDEATKKLRHANTKLKEMDATKDEFISMASHQLRTPLTTIKGYLSMILEGDVGKVKAEEKEMIQQAFDSAENMVDLIADLLNISRMQSGKFVIENKPTQLVDMVTAEVHRMSETASNKKITLSFEKPASFPILLLEENNMRQVRMNFLDNALYYTPAGGSVSVTLAAGSDSVSYTVTDNGMGVPKAVQHHLFSKFYRADNARKMRPDGTGLGLFMAKKVIVAQGGAIIFKSVEGKGSTFGFSFPRAKLEVKK